MPSAPTASGLTLLAAASLAAAGDVDGQMCGGLGSQLPLEHHVPVEMHVGAVIGFLVAAVVGEGADGRRVEVVGTRVRIDEGDIRALAAGNVDADADAVLPGVGDELARLGLHGEGSGTDSHALLERGDDVAVSLDMLVVDKAA